MSGLSRFGDGNLVPIRVAQVMGKMLGGGVESVVMNYYRHIDRNKVQFDFLVDADSTRVPEEEIKALGGRVFRIPPIPTSPSLSQGIGQAFPRGTLADRA